MSLIIRDRDKECVQRSQGGCNGVLTNGHVLPGRYLTLRFDIRPDGNCHGQCWGHNYKHINHQSFYNDWYIGKFGYERFQELMREYYANPHKPSDKELRLLLAELKEKYGHLLYAKKSL